MRKSVPIPFNCPGCGVQLGANDNPQFSRVIGVYDMDLDITTHWECPDCSQRIERFAK